MNDQAGVVDPEPMASLVEAVPEEPAAAPKPTYPDKLEDVDRFSIENIFLKLQNAQLQVEKHDTAKSQLLEVMQKLQLEMNDKKEELSKKYGVDIGRSNIMADGTILRTPPGMPNLPPGFPNLPGMPGRQR